MKLSLNKETLRGITEAQSEEVKGGVLYTQAVTCYSFYCQTNRKGCLTHIVDCMTNKNLYC